MEFDLGQAVTLKMSRRLIVMRKVCDIQDVSDRSLLTRESCRPKRRTGDIRSLMDQVDLPDNDAYTHYREKV
eukprot:CAMPEP_0176459796 /NCGR_PEP_ID=MMETSP0127-20121128/33527_1 /TAXON_ID=938130 /ORGANISM="Platyophrya macrostoma, Strain WH" /LENGTH=71 /DNA_ID=CAMNT_0017850875 /DNA_START=1 /DNA_END=212 /DNA_ORIENTATION=-